MESIHQKVSAKTIVLSPMCKVRFVQVPVAVVVEFIVARKRQERTEARTERKENLSRCINPNLKPK